MNTRTLDSVAFFFALGTLTLGARSMASSVGHVTGSAPAIPSAATATLPPVAGTKPVLRSRFRGELALTTVDIDGQGVHIRAELRSPRLELTPAPPPGATSELSKPFYFVVSQGGDLGSFEFGKGVSVDVRGQLRAMVTSLHVAPPAGAISTWRTTEQDMTGTYEARYSAEGRTVTKVKERYTGVSGPKGPSPLPSSSRYGVTSTARFDIGDSGSPTQAFENEVLDVTIHGLRVVSASQTLSRGHKIELHPEYAHVKEPDLEGEAATSAETFAAARRNIQQKRVKGRDYPALLHDFKEAAGTQDTTREAAAMTALFQLDPVTAQATREFLADPEGDKLKKAMLTSSLAAAGTRESQQALTSVARDTSLPKETRTNALASLTLAKNPTNETVEEVAETTHDKDRQIADTAGLALGGEIKTLNESRAIETKDAVQLLIDRLAACKTDDERVPALLALGNTADPKALSAILPHVSSASSEVRSAAVTSLRFQTDNAAASAIIAATADKNEEVRVASARTIPFRPFDPLRPAMETMLKNDPSVPVRLAVIDGIHSKLKEDPSLTALLEWVLEHDKSGSVKNAVKMILTKS